ESFADAVPEAQPDAPRRVQSDDLDPDAVPEIAEQVFGNVMRPFRVLEHEARGLLPLFLSQRLHVPLGERLRAGGPARLENGREQAHELDLRRLRGHEGKMTFDPKCFRARELRATRPGISRLGQSARPVNVTFKRPETIIHGSLFQGARGRGGEYVADFLGTPFLWVVATIVLYGIAYWGYGKWIDRRVWRPDAKRTT